jgi:hypothetical protein
MNNLPLTYIKPCRTITQAVICGLLTAKIVVYPTGFEVQISAVGKTFLRVLPCELSLWEYIFSFNTT